MITIERKRELIHRAFVLLLFLATAALFFGMIRTLILTVLMGAIFSGMTYPLYTRLLEFLRGRKPAAATASLVLVLLVIIGPLIFLLLIVASQAVSIGESVAPWVSEHLREDTALNELFARLPFGDRLEPYREQITRKLGEVAAFISSFLVRSLSALTQATAHFLFHLFIMLYSMFFFLLHGPDVLDHVLRFVPLSQRDKALMLDKYVSVSRATLKGTLVIGVVQGGLAGLAFAVVGIDGATFWGTIMAVLSIIPGIGTALVWVPAVVYLAMAGKIAAAIGLTLWCAVVVGTVDNLLRPVLVGRDTQMPDLLILLSTFGGLVTFGPVGFIIGPVFAAVFIAVWNIYGEVFGDLLSGPQTSRPGA
jgi:predicted PurR-regulated permease PerM